MIAERFAKFVHRGIKAVIEIHKGIGRPKPCPQVFTADERARLIEQYDEEGKWLVLHT